MEERLINTFKGFAWGVVLVIIISALCGCSSSKAASTSKNITLEDVTGVSVTSDSISTIELNKSTFNENKAFKTQENTYIVEWSKPDTKGKQYKVRETYTGKDATMRVETSNRIIQIKYEERLQRSFDSISRKLKRLEENQKHTERTSDSVSILDNIKVILVVVLLIFVVWIIAKRIGFY